MIIRIKYIIFSKGKFYEQLADEKGFVLTLNEAFKKLKELGK